MKCANGKWKYGEHGNCQFDTLAACKAAAAAIHIHEDVALAAPKKPKKPGGAIPMQPAGPHVPAMPPATVAATAAPKPIVYPLIVEEGKTKPTKKPKAKPAC
jgi:hypothetical protein